MSTAVQPNPLLSSSLLAIAEQSNPQTEHALRYLELTFLITHLLFFSSNHLLSSLSLSTKLTCDSSMAQSEDEKDSRVLYSNASTYDCPSFSNLLKTVLTTNSSILRFQGQREASQKDTVVTTKPEVAGVQLTRQAECANPSTNVSPLSPPAISVQHSATAMVGLVSPQQKSDHNSSPSHVVKKTPAADGYSWRKYGQKQVKSSKSSRSYYRCAHSNCHAKKKVQHCDESGHVIDIVYLGHHNHDPFQNKPNISREPASTVKLAAGSHVDSAQKVDEDSRQSSHQMAESEQHSSSSSNGNVGIKVEEHNGNKLESENIFTDAEVQEKHGAEPGLLKRLSERSEYSASDLEANKESKIVVHAAADGGMSSDGYRWRKYGQKMVKGNSHLRSYYRCTSAGCPAHKHVERVIDDAAATTITYAGKHDHDMPVPKKQKLSKCPARISSAAIADDDHCKNPKSLSSQRISTKRSIDREGDFMDEKVLELGGEKALESAQTLLSMGIELRPC